MENHLVPNDSGLLHLRIASIETVAECVLHFVLRAHDDVLLPLFDAGAHIDVHLPSGGIRQYSLCGDPSDRRSYEIAVLCLPDGEGGSLQMHNELFAGAEVVVSPPRNLFPLARLASEDGNERHVLIAGGIGITPIMAMQCALERSKAPYVLHYCASSEARIAFQGRVTHRARSGVVRIHFDDPSGRPGLELSSVAQDLRPGDHVYVCGPAGMLRAAETAFAEWPRDRFHTEAFSFGSKPAASDAEGRQAFELILGRSETAVTVSAHESMRDALRRAGLVVNSGACAEAMCALLDGEVDHGDSDLGLEARGHSLCLCHARARGDYLVIDL